MKNARKWAWDPLTEDADLGKKIIFSRGIIGSFFFENEQGEPVADNGDRYRAMLKEFLFTKIEEEDIGFNRTALLATQPKLYSMFCALFLEIALSAAEDFGP